MPLIFGATFQCGGAIVIVLDGAFARTIASPNSLGTIARIDPVADDFLAGVEIANGEFLMATPADDIACALLHEAGHLVVTPSLFRHRAAGDLSERVRIMNDWIDGYGMALEPGDPEARRGLGLLDRWGTYCERHCANPVSAPGSR